MHTIQPGSKVLVTGANGYISVWLIETLLEQGYQVRGTVRSLERSSFLRNTFKSYVDKLELVAVEDITQDGAFDEAVKGMNAIVHLASPVTPNADDPKDIIDPAKKGTTGILKSALHHAPDCRRIIIVSSLAAVFHDTDKPIKIDDKDWNTEAIERVDDLGRNASGFDKYAAAKTLAEKAAWEFYENHKAQAKWDMVFIHPPYVFGPTLVPHSSPSELNMSLKYWYDAVVDREGSQKSLMEPSKPWVDVRDLAKAIAKALVVEGAGDERILVIAGRPSVWQTWLDTVNNLSPSPIPSHAPGTDKALPKGSAEGKNAPHLIDYDTSIAENVLGLKYISMEESARDTLADFERRGW
ncbi:hypothetical protein M378DRAFT_13913 [Amanita muscaria Koide BX008]|uniref:NAD-dependent epimerase/dehydratase domain-containing protein n=1 Tax=Amanita muscaria (strain Koide BX008) TaxID=946122 RepID=A0A0C2T2Q7_AMAMK|nr:hypothetical protein M378DRAFT_13913 [Amanita muscaria Koide BX008]